MEPTWIITLIISATVPTIITTLISLYIKRKFASYFDEKAESAKLKEDKKKEDQNNQISEIIRNELIPIATELKNLSGQLSKIENGTLSSLRNDILVCYYKCFDKGYRNDYDYKNIHDMFNSYSTLNGNSFICDIMSRFDDLPSKEEFRKKNVCINSNSKKGNKTLLLEDN